MTSRAVSPARAPYKKPATLWRGPLEDFRKHPMSNHPAVTPLLSSAPPEPGTGPQPENGCTWLANELLEAILRHGFTKQQLLVIFAIARNHYGWRKRHEGKVARCSNSWLSNLTGLDRSDCSRTRAELERLGVVIHHHLKPELIGINKHYKRWKMVVKHQHVGETPTVGVVNHQQKGWGNTTHISKKTISKGKKIAAPSAPPDSRIKALVDKWADLYLRAKGIKCAHLAAAGKIFRALLATLTPEQIEKHLQAYLIKPHFRGHHIGGLPDFIASGPGKGKPDTRRAGLGPEGIDPYAALAKESRIDVGGTDGR